MAYPGAHSYAVDLLCKCKESWKSGYSFDEIHLGFVCLTCWKEWLPEEFVQKTEEDPVCHDEKTYLSPVRNNSADKEDVQVTARKSIIPDYAPDKLERGNHVMWQDSFESWQHAVVEKVNGTTITFIEYNSNGVIVRTDRDMADKEESLYLVAYTDEVCHFNPVELVLARANSLLGLEGNDLLQRNCENFATFCKTGISSVEQKKVHTQKVTGILKDIGLDKVEQHVTVLAQKFGANPKTSLSSDGIAKNIKGIKVGVRIAIEGYQCIVDLGEMYSRRKVAPADGTLGYSRKEFVEDIVQRISSALFNDALFAGVGMGLSMVPGVPGLGLSMVPRLGPVAVKVGSILGGAAGLAKVNIGGYTADIARAIANLIIDDRPVRLEQLSPGDHIVIYGNRLHPRCHCIVLSTVEEDQTMAVIRFKRETGVVYEELSYDEQSPPLKILYPENADKFSSEEIVDRALDALESYDKKYNILTNNCKDFAYSMILKPEK